MNGERIVIEGRAWLKEVTEHWPPGSHANGPSEYSVTFYNPEDRDQWVCNCRIPAGEADLGPDGLREIFREAGSRSWRDPGGDYWRIGTCPGGSGSGSDGEGIRDTIWFRRREQHGAETIKRDVGTLPSLGHLSDEELREILAPVV